MTKYLSYQFNDTPQLASTYDELPLWSAPFGLLLLNSLTYRKNITIVDIGYGTGFPLLEIASRFGETCKCYGVDIWQNAQRVAQEKIRSYDLKNVTLLETSAENIPLPDNSVDLIASNLGINNFDNKEQVFNECYRLLNKGGELAIATNLFGHWKEFYEVFEDVLAELNMNDAHRELQVLQENRGTVDSVKELFLNTGFKIGKKIEDKFEMKFADGTAFLNHYFVKLGWISSLRDVVVGAKREEVFACLESRLNDLSQENGLTLSVPMLYVSGIK